MTQQRIYILGGAQTDFARNWTREGHSIYDLFHDVVDQGLAQTGLAPADIEVGHVGNFAAEVYVGQGQLGGFFGHIHPDWATLPASRHEAACASGSMALLAAMADLRAGNYQTACVVGIEIMRNVPGEQGAENLRSAAWAGRESEDTPFVWPCLFNNLAEEYDRRYGLDMAHLAQISEINFANAKRNPLAQTRKWAFTDTSFSQDDAANPPVLGRLRKQDCGQITDGAAVVFLATEEKAAEYARSRGIALESLPFIKGWGHRNAPLLAQAKFDLSADQPYIYPHVNQLFKDALGRAGLSGVGAIDGLEVHDCFNITEYMVIDHIGLHQPGQAWRAVEEGSIAPGGRLPINASGGLIGLGHPVGATGVRMALDCYKQVTGKAGDYQIEGAKNMMTFNLGGTATTCASLVIGV